MLEFIKMFGLGILYTVLFPFIVAIFALYIVYVFGNYLVLEAINLFGFFFGYSFSVETELEKKLASMRVNSSESGNVTEEFEEFFEQVDVTDDLRGSDNNV